MCYACCDVTLRCSFHSLLRCSLSSLLCFNIIHCKYATPLIFFNVYCIFFGFRAFYLFFNQIFAVILHRNSKSSHVHRTFIALPSHTRTRVTAMRRSGSAKARSSSLRRSKYKQDFSKLTRFFYDNEK